jgi:hypothetical protein
VSDRNYSDSTSILSKPKEEQNYQFVLLSFNAQFDERKKKLSSPFPKEKIRAETERYQGSEHPPNEIANHKNILGKDGEKKLGKGKRTDLNMREKKKNECTQCLKGDVERYSGEEEYWKGD